MVGKEVHYLGLISLRQGCTQQTQISSCLHFLQLWVTYTHSYAQLFFFLNKVWVLGSAFRSLLLVQQGSYTLNSFSSGCLPFVSVICVRLHLLAGICRAYFTLHNPRRGGSYRAPAGQQLLLFTPGMCCRHRYLVSSLH